MDLFSRVVPFPRLHDEVFVGRGQRDLVVAGRGVGLGGREAQVVLVSQLFFDLGIYLVDRLLLGDLEEASTSFLGDAL